MTRVERWERRAEIPLMLLAVAFTIAYAWPVLVPSLDRDLRTLFDVLAWTVWGAFALDLTARLYLADERGRYALRHWYDVALVVLPVLRPLRLLRLLALVRILDRSAASSVAGRVLIYVSGATVLAVALGALAVLDAEQDAAGGNITTYGDAVWWACTTVTTVGYGDHFPDHWRRPLRGGRPHARRHRTRGNRDRIRCFVDARSNRDRTRKQEDG